MAVCVQEDAIFRLRQSFLSYSNDAVVARIIPGAKQEPFGYACDSGTRWTPTVGSTSSFADQAGRPVSPLSSSPGCAAPPPSHSPAPSVAPGAVRELLRKYYSEEACSDEGDADTALPSISCEALGVDSGDEGAGGARSAPQGLDYTQTIYGLRQSNGMGLRVAGRRWHAPAGVGARGREAHLERHSWSSDVSAEPSDAAVAGNAAAAVDLRDPMNAPALLHPPPHLPTRWHRGQAAAYADSTARAAHGHVPGDLHSAGAPPEEPDASDMFSPTSEASSAAVLGLPTPSEASAMDILGGTGILVPGLQDAASPRPRRAGGDGGATVTGESQFAGMPGGDPDTPLFAPDAAVDAARDDVALPFARRPRLPQRNRRPPHSLLSQARTQRPADNADVHPELVRFVQVGASDGGANAISVRLYFPESSTSLDGCPVFDVSVRREVTMGELIGYGLYRYAETQHMLPPHPSDAADRADPDAWVLRMVDDGSVDEDYPSLDRTLVVGRFGEDEFAVCPSTTPIHASQRAVSGSLPPLRAGGQPEHTAERHVAGSLLGRAAPSAATGPAPVASTLRARLPLQVMVVPAAGGVVTVDVEATSSAVDVVSALCAECGLKDAASYALLDRDSGTAIRMDHPTASLHGHSDLALVERSSLPEDTAAELQHACGGGGLVPEQPRYTNAMDLISNYKAYSVTRRYPISVGRNERVITLDGEWVHIIRRPAEKRRYQAHSTSYHVRSILACAQYPRTPNIFKLLVARDKVRDTKRYDFEAEDAGQAAEVVADINHARRM
ncbi:Component of a membrane-bound complex containing the Tor2p kinase [Malassezia sp. CBS 17886]|nr:Component of a membrane-bound complex containing the Tor2p kinase [Malassezia sp. CBS 17886]